MFTCFLGFIKMIHSELMFIFMMTHVIIVNGYWLDNKINHRKHERFPKLKNVFNLTGQDLEHIPSRNVEHVKVLDLKNNSIGSIESEDLQSFSSLEILNLESNKLVFISFGSFRKLRNLQMLNLRQNRLTELKARHFEGLFRLRFLDLGENPLLHLQTSTFEGLMQLEKLHLDRCKLTSFHMTAVTNLLLLDTLDLSRNYLNSLDVSKTRRKLSPSLRVLKLSENPWICDCRAKALISSLNSTKLLSWYSKDSHPICCEPSQYAGIHWNDLPLENISCSSNNSIKSKNFEDKRSFEIHKTFHCFQLGESRHQFKDIVKLPEESHSTNSEAQYHDNTVTKEKIISIVALMIIVLEIALILSMVILIVYFFQRIDNTGYYSIIS